MGISNDIAAKDRAHPTMIDVEVQTYEYSPATNQGKRRHRDQRNLVLVVLLAGKQYRIMQG